jgi:hypothetical protein
MYMIPPSASSLMLLKQEVCCDCDFALAKAGSNKAANIAMMAMTTSNSINVKAPRTAIRARSVLETTAIPLINNRATFPIQRHLAR